MTFTDNAHFVRVCLEEGLTKQRALYLLGFAIRHKIGIDDAFMTLILVLGLITNATALNLSSTQALARDAAAAVAKELGADINEVVRERILHLNIQWAIAAGVLATLLLAVTLSLGVTLGLQQRPPAAEFWSVLAENSSADAWQQIIEQNPTLPDAMRACNPASKNYGLNEEREYCSFYLYRSSGGLETNWLHSALLAPSQLLGRYTPVSLIAIGLGLGLGLAPLGAYFARRKMKVP